MLSPSNDQMSICENSYDFVYEGGGRDRDDDQNNERIDTDIKILEHQASVSSEENVQL